MAKPSSSKKVSEKHAAYMYRGMKTYKWMQRNYPLGSMSEGNDGSKSAEYPPESGKKAPGKMPKGKKNSY